MRRYPTPIRLEPEERSMSKHVWILPLLMIAAAGNHSGAGTAQEPTQFDIDSAARALMAEHLAERPVDAVSVAMSIGGETIFAEGLGPARPGKSAIASADSSFSAAPMAHAWLVTAALQLESAGKLSHEDLVTQHLPDHVAKGSPVRVGDLLAHTSGLVDYRDFASEGLLSQGSARTSQLAALVRDLEPESEPGECVKECATDTLLVAALLEKVTGKSIEEVLQESIFDKAKMTDSGYDSEFAETGTSDAAAREGEDSPAFLARGLTSSAADLVRFQRGLVELSFFDSATLDSMTEVVRLSDGTRANTGLGVRHVRLHETDGLVLGAEGSSDSARIAYYPEFDLTVAVMVRWEDPPIDSLSRELARLVIEEPEVESLDLPRTEEQLEPYVGNYQIGCTTVVIRYEAGHLVLDQLDEDPLTLSSQGEHRFIARDESDIRLTFEVEGEFAQAFILDKYGSRSRAVRFRGDR